MKDPVCKGHEVSGLIRPRGGRAQDKRLLWQNAEHASRSFVRCSCGNAEAKQQPRMKH